MSEVQVRPFRRADREQLTALVNAHIQAVVPGVSVSVNTVHEPAGARPGRVHRRPLGGRAGHPGGRAAPAGRGRRPPAALRLGRGRRPGLPRHRRDQLAAVLAGGEPLARLGGGGRLADGRLPGPAPVMGGGALARRRRPARPRRVRRAPAVAARPGAVRAGRVRPRRPRRDHPAGQGRRAAPASAPPLEGLRVERSVGESGTRLTARLGDELIGFVEVETNLAEGGRLAHLGGWADVGNLHVAEAYRRRGVATWLVGQAADWLRLARVDRLLAYVWPEEQDQLGLLSRAGFRELTRTARGWPHRSAPGSSPEADATPGPRWAAGPSPPRGLLAASRPSGRASSPYLDKPRGAREHGPQIRLRTLSRVARFADELAEAERVERGDRRGARERRAGVRRGVDDLLLARPRGMISSGATQAERAGRRRAPCRSRGCRPARRPPCSAPSIPCGRARSRSRRRSPARRAVRELRRPFRNASGGTTQPPRPRTGSISTAPTSPFVQAASTRRARDRRPPRPRVGRERDVRVELLREGRAVALAQAARRQRRVAEAVVRALERDEARLAREERRRLDRGRHRVAAALPEQHARAHAGMQRGDALEQRELGVGRVHVAERLHQPARSAPRSRAAPTTARARAAASRSPRRGRRSGSRRRRRGSIRAPRRARSAASPRRSRPPAPRAGAPNAGHSTCSSRATAARDIGPGGSMRISGGSSPVASAEGSGKSLRALVSILLETEPRRGRRAQRLSEQTRFRPVFFAW